ncbi:rhomboid family intramembrane serine protease GlpG [Orbaceae bacterium ac157xtp]
MFLVSFKQAEFAYTFADYLATKNITVRVEVDDSNGYSLFLDDVKHDELEFVKRELEPYLNNPFSNKYQQATWREDRDAKVNRSSFSSQNFKNIFPKISTNGSLTIAVSFFCIVVFILLSIVGDDEVLSYLGFPISDEYRFEVWRYITPIFIHFSILHILFNLSWWWYLGGMVERYLGVWKLVEVVILTGLLSNFAQDYFTGPYFGGLSGVVYGLTGYVWFLDKLGYNKNIKFETSMFVFVLIWMGLGFFNIISDMANMAHLVGLVVGILIAFKDVYLRKEK